MNLFFSESDQELNASLNHLRLAVARALCCVFLEPADPMMSIRDPVAIQSAVRRHSELIYQADMVISNLSQTMNGATMVDSDETEKRVRDILKNDFINRALNRTTND